MKRPSNVKQFDGFRKNKWQSLTLQIPALISLCLGHPSTALSATAAPFSYEIARAENLNTVFNNLFQYHLNNSPGSYEKDASKYLLSLPPLAKESPLNQNYKCSANVSAEFCRLQQNFLDLIPSSFSEALIKDPQNPRVGDNTIQSILEQTITPSLNKNDTMVVIIPGIFGEFINQTAFGEIFGEGEATRNLETTNFSMEFKNSLEKCSKDASASSPCYDGRFSLSRWVPSIDGSASINFNDSTQIQNELINEWIKVASVDSPSHDKTLFKVVVLKLKAMSMESMGSQSILADIYLRRFNKFMEFYTNIMKQKTPSRIIFVGYSRGAPIGYEMLTKLNSNEAKYNQYKNSEWAQNIAAMVSVAGVIFGSSLADATVVGENARDWHKTPVKTKMIQAFSLLANKFTPLPHDNDQLKKLQQNETLSTIIAANTHILDILNEKIQSFRQQLNEEIKTINQGELKPNEASALTKVDVLTSQMELARKALGYAYTLADDKSILEEKLSSIKGVKDIASQINWAGVKAKVTNLSTINSNATNSELKQIGLELYTILNKYMQLQKDSKILEVFSSLSADLKEGLKASKSLASKDFREIEPGKLLKMFRDLLALTKEFKPEELFLKLQESSLASNVPAASFQEILSHLTLNWKNKYTALRQSLPDSQATLALNAQLMKNWGADESLQRIKTAAFHDKTRLR